MSKDTQEVNYSQIKVNNVQVKQSQINYIIAFIVMLFFLFFMAGFYWGRRTALKNVLNQFENDSLADKLSYAFYTLQDIQDSELSESEDSEQLQSENVKPEILEAKNDDVVDESVKLYRAYLAGFGTEKTAKKCFNYMQSCGFDIELLTRNSKTSKGRSVKWYQIVTKPLADMHELQNIVEKAKKTVKLNNDIQIVTLEHID